MYCGEVADMIQPLFAIGMKTPMSMWMPALEMVGGHEGPA
jgi:hypothetical protein